MGVLMQAFYWDCPRLENKEYQWWQQVKQALPGLKKAGFTALWLPPAAKAANLGGPSMGYDPYDYYDLGEFDQKGATATWFGAKPDLLQLIAAAHELGLCVYADLVLNHNSGGDAQELNPYDQQERWTLFKPLSGIFPRDYTCFHPSPYESWDNGVFGDMPDLCHRNPRVYTQLIEYAQWLLAEIGFDGFRYDFVKGYGSWMVRAIQELRVLRNGRPFKPFGVGECWDGDRNIEEWLDEINSWSDNGVSAFDFALRDVLKQLCDSPGFNLRDLPTADALMWDRPADAVTFVENHDIVRDNPIINDKMLAYAVILTHEGYPCVFWQDYFTWGLQQPGQSGGIEALVRIHEDYAGGPTSVLHVEDNLYIMQRNGWQEKEGLVLVLNNRQSGWHGARVQTRWPNTLFVPLAWSGNDPGLPIMQNTDEDGAGNFWAPPRGYVVYTPQG